MADLITSTLLATLPTVRFGMSTQRGAQPGEPFPMNMSYTVGDQPERVDANRRAFFQSLGIPHGRLAIPMQCHSTKIVVVNKPGMYDACDGLVTTEQNLWLSLSVADCIPLVLVDTRLSVIAALHAGWRGTVGGIATRGMEMLVTRFGTRPGDVRAFVGPSAGLCCYEVGMEVAAQFARDVVDRTNGSIHLDLKKENMQQLIRCGVQKDSIEVSPLCTICSPGFLHSYRRERHQSGRMLAAVALVA